MARGTPPIVLPPPVNSESIYCLTTWHCKPTVKSRQLSIIKRCKTVGTPPLVHHLEDPGIQLPVIVIHDSAESICYAIQLHCGSRKIPCSKQLANMLKTSCCNSGFLLPTKSMRDTFILSMNHLILWPLS